MSIIVHDMDEIYTIRMTHDNENVDFFFKQLTYREKSEMVMKTTEHKQGVVIQDMNMSDYLAIQMALVDVSGLFYKVVNDNGDIEEKPFQLEFDVKNRVTDKCMDSIFNTPFEDKLVYTAKHLPKGIPAKITHPFTDQEIEGVEIINPPGGLPKKS